MHSDRVGLREGFTDASAGELMPRQGSREKVARFRLRKAGDLPELPLCQCGKQIRNGRDLCSRCRKRTPDGKAADAERKRRARQARQIKEPP